MSGVFVFNFVCASAQAASAGAERVWEPPCWLRYESALFMTSPMPPAPGTM